jgi:hypothetical protein
MRFSYKTVKSLCKLTTEARMQIQRTKNIQESLERIKWSAKTELLGLKNYQKQWQNFNIAPNTTTLNHLILKLRELTKSKSKHIDFDELTSDMEFLQEYYEEQSWSDVTRWLTNIDSTIRETFSHYMETLKES